MTFIALDVGNTRLKWAMYEDHSVDSPLLAQGAVFLENISDPRLMNRISQETGAKIGDKLFTDSLSVENGPAPTYIDMMRANLASILKALRP